MAKSKIGFHTGPGGIKQGLGDWERKLNKAGQAFGVKAVDEYGPIFEALHIGRENGVENWLGSVKIRPDSNDGVHEQLVRRRPVENDKQ